MIVSIATGSFAGLAVANNQFALAASDWCHRIDGFNACLQWLGNWLSFSNASSNHLHGASLGSILIGPFTV